MGKTNVSPSDGPDANLPDARHALENAARWKFSGETTAAPRQVGRLTLPGWGLHAGRAEEPSHRSEQQELKRTFGVAKYTRTRIDAAGLDDRLLRDRVETHEAAVFFQKIRASPDRGAPNGNGPVGGGYDRRGESLDELPALADEAVVFRPAGEPASVAGRSRRGSGR